MDGSVSDSLLLPSSRHHHITVHLPPPPPLKSKRLAECNPTRGQKDNNRLLAGGDLFLFRLSYENDFDSFIFWICFFFFFPFGFSESFFYGYVFGNVPTVSNTTHNDVVPSYRYGRCRAKLRAIIAYWPVVPKQQVARFVFWYQKRSWALCYRRDSLVRIFLSVNDVFGQQENGTKSDHMAVNLLLSDIGHLWKWQELKR